MAIFKTREQVDGNRFVADITREVTIPEVIAVLNREQHDNVAQVDGNLRVNYIVYNPGQGMTFMPVFGEDMALLKPPKPEKVDIIIRDNVGTVLSLKATKSSCLACPLKMSSGSTLSIDYSKFDALINVLTCINKLDSVGS